MRSSGSDWWNVSARTDITANKPIWDAVFETYVGRSGRGWLRARCAMCEEIDGKPDLKESLGFNTQTGGYNCYKCGAKGRLPVSYLDRLGDVLDFDEASPVSTSKITRLEPATGFVPLFEEPALSVPGYEYLRAYAQGRGIPNDVARDMQIGTGTGALSGRIVVQLMDAAGIYCGWYGRDATGRARVPHRYSRGMVREGLFWNASQIERETDAPLFVVEGCYKTVPVWPDGVGTLGKPLDSHIAPLLRARRPVVVCLDGDAWREGQALAWRLQLNGVLAVNLRLPPKTDPDDHTRSWLLSRAAHLLERTS